MTTDSQLTRWPFTKLALGQRQCGTEFHCKRSVTKRSYGFVSRGTLAGNTEACRAGDRWRWLNKHLGIVPLVDGHEIQQGEGEIGGSSASVAVCDFVINPWNVVSTRDSES
ncbi:uncharacterized protein LOC119589701 [Penaeus monodon]|uniref:uncharacterized protein LOC119589701 n=1 Tax=Penaeus monodon TaxID=6687 RepID=UPI0018A6D78C|nr:uncharacterized protein LOC119589701 [Penaeus monodon]